MHLPRIARSPSPLLFLLAVVSGFSPTARPDSLQSLVTGDTAFGLTLYSQLASGHGNLFFSPYSISTCLAMTYAGAQGETAKQISRVLHLDQDHRKVHAFFSKLQQQLSEAGDRKGIE